MKTIFALGAFLFIGVAQGATLKISAGSPPVIIDSQPIRCIVIDQTSKCTCGLFAGGWGIEGSRPELREISNGHESFEECMEALSTVQACF